MSDEQKRKIGVKIMNEKKKSSEVMIHELRQMSDCPTWTDPDKLAAFLYESLKPYEDPLPQVRQGISDALEPRIGEPGFVLVAEIDQKVVGALIMLRTGMKGYIPENFLLMVAVDPSTRGKGVGAQIIKRSFEIADGDVKLHVEYDNPAKRLYERLGMTSKYAEMRYQK
ncbi:MAG: GNAT family N-acetyltransferase [candidate division Zixibacteria bacterium]|nr:GNAT family N-acetyltransferase [candidate division Zixibacteria bacterium]